MGSQLDGQLDSGSSGIPGLESQNTTVSRLARQDRVPWYNKPNLRVLYFLMLPTCLAVQLNWGFAASMVNGLQAVPSWLEYYNHPRSASLGLMSSMYPLGSFAAMPFIPFVVGKIGRRYPILFGVVISVFGGILQGSASNFTMFILARFILGFANALCVVAASSLIAELSHPNERAVIGSLFTISFSLGAVGAAAVTLATFSMTSNWGWRIPSFLQIVPPLLQVFFIWYLPESPRWLISRGRGSEAYIVLVGYHAEGNENSEFVRAEYTQIKETLEAELKASQMDQKELLFAPGMRKRVIIACFLGFTAQWSGVGLISYFLSPILDSIGIHDNRTKNIINLARICWSSITATFSALIISEFPRRRIYLACSILVFVIFSAWTIACAEFAFTHDKVFATAVIALIFLYAPAYNLSFSLTHTYLVELFPFHVRATGIAIYEWTHQGSAFLIQLVNPIAIDYAGWRWYIVYCVWNAFQVVFVYLMFPETSGRTLEELTFLYEGEQEAIRQAEAETLRQHGDFDTYGSMQNDRRRGVHGEQVLGR